jgi:CubicO group peptidase (beta-lactamase class C family)
MIIGAGPAMAAAIPADFDESVRAIMQPLVDPAAPAPKRYVGAIVGVIAGPERAYFPFGRTSLDRDQAPTPETLFEIGSVTKTFTGTLLADAVLSGRARLDDPIAACAPGQTNATCFQGQPTTLLHLATHTAGFPQAPTNLPQTLNPYDEYTPELLNDFLSTFALPRPPGQSYAYSNIGMGLLGNRLAQDQGKTFEQLVVERIAGPLAMNDTRMELDPDQKTRLADGYLMGEPCPHWDMTARSALAPAGGLRSTARDLLAYLGANLGLTATAPGDAMKLAQEARFQASPATSLGLAWHINQPNHIHWHNGGTFGFTSFVAFDRESATAVVILTNSLLMTDTGTLDPRVDEAGVRIMNVLRGIP